MREYGTIASMKMHHILYGIVALLMVLPLTSSAYFTTAQHAHQLSENSVLFLIEYRFGINQFDLYMPVFGERNLPFGAETDALGYVILEDGTATDVGAAEGIVLSNTEREGAFYKIPKGTAAKMTFALLFTIPEDALEADYQLQIQELPFYTGDDRMYRKLMPSELQHYITPEVELNEANGSKN